MREEGCPPPQGNKDRHRSQRDQGGWTLRDCDLCGGKHYNKRKECRDTCKHCHIRGSHRISECRGRRRKNWDNNHEKKYRRSRSQEKFSNRTSERQGTPGKALRIQIEGERRRWGSPNTSPEENRDRYHRRGHSNPRDDRRDRDIRGTVGRVRQNQINSPHRVNLFRDHSLLFDTVRLTPQQTNKRTTPWAGQQPTQQGVP